MGKYGDPGGGTDVVSGGGGGGSPWDWVGNVAGGLANLGSSFVNSAAQAEANRANAEQGRLNRDFQRDMSSTAHQREVADLQAAGLNPILSANGGASSPSGSAPTMNPVMTDFGAAVSRSVSSALERRAANKDIESKDASIAATKAAQKTSEAQARATTASAKNAEAVHDAVKAKAKLDERTSKIDEKMAPADAVIDRLMPALQGVLGVSSAVGRARSSKRALDLKEGDLLNKWGLHGLPQPRP